jgi:hypothetical protein
LGWIVRAVVLKGHGGLDGAKHANQPALDRTLLEQAARQGLLVNRRVGEATNRAAVLIDRLLH